MSLDLLPCRGNVYRIGTGGGDGFKISPGLTGSDSSPVLMQSLSVDDQVVNLPVLTLDGVRILYVFGRAWGNIGIGGIALLGRGGTGSALSSVVSWFDTRSAASSEGKASVSLPGNAAYKFYPTGLSIGDPNPEFQFFPFMITGKIIGT